MRIISLKIDGYGVWSDLTVEDFSDGLNVLYGPNEAGKTTLLEFIRSMFYGFAESRRHYFPPIHGGRPGGMAEVDGPHGRYEIARHWQAAEGTEQVVLTAADGTRQGEHLVKAMLADVDEQIFNNVFAVELREMQELGALGDTAAAEMLYNLTAGLDRVSLVEVLRDLQTSRNRILDAEGKTCTITNLLAQHEKIRATIEELGGLTRRFAHLSGERSQLTRDLSRFEEERNQVERQSKILELALSLRERWSQRAAITGQLAELGPIAPLPEKMLARLDALNAKLERRRRQIAELREKRTQLRSEAAGIVLNEPLLRQFARIEALQEQESWYVGVRKQIADLEAEIALHEGELAAARHKLGVKDESISLPEKLSRRSFAALQSSAKKLHHARVRLEETRTEAQSAREAAESLAKKVADALAARRETDLTEALEKSGRIVSQYNRRLQIDERLDQLARHQTELEEQSRRAVERQLLPGWMLAGLGLLFILCVLLVFTGLVLQPFFSGSTHWLTALLGAVGIAGTYFAKSGVEKSNVRRIETCQKQLAMVAAQLKQAKEERDELDRLLPRGGGPLDIRRKTAEDDLAELEVLVPLESTRKTATEKASATDNRAAEAEADFKSARRIWRDTLASAGLPAELSPQQVRGLARDWSGISHNRRRIDQCIEELDRRTKETDALAARVAQVASDANVTLAANDPVEQLKQLVQALANEQAAAARRESLRGQIQRMRRLQARNEEAVGRLNHRRRSLFFEAGAEDEEGFRQKTLAATQADKLKHDRETLDRDIAAGIADQCSEQAIAELLDSAPVTELESRGKLLRDRLSVLDAQVRERLEKRGQLTAQIQTLAEDRQLPRLQLELAAVEGRIAEALKRWRILAVTCRILENIRSMYERERQPETLKEASNYLARLTRGRYTRVWTPLEGKALRVDGADGHSLPVESLSRGTREQLFLSLRLALSAGYARRGAALPMVLDDVLVNFDHDRAAAAAEVLRDFAAAGHQLLVCTCHEHIAAIFDRLEAPIDRLPGNSLAEGAVISFHRVAMPEEPKREKPRPTARRKSAAKIKITEEDLAPSQEDPLDADPAPEPPRPPLAPPRANSPPKRKPPIPKKVVKPQGVFDVDFFENAEESAADSDSEEIEDDRSLWQTDEAQDDIEISPNGEFDVRGNGELL